METRAEVWNVEGLSRYRHRIGLRHDVDMARTRHLSPSYWVVLAVFLAFGALSMANAVLGWEQE